MQTQCTQQTFEFEALGRREVVARFDGGPITSDAGGLFLRQVEDRTGIIRQLTRCFTNHRDEDLIEHTVEELLRQRIFGLALGYEDLNDHDQLRYDPLLATLVGKEDPTGEDRPRERDRGKALSVRLKLKLIACKSMQKPEGDPNSINLASNGAIAVSILTTTDFDAALVDASTVQFAEASAVHSALEDVDDDGDLDMVLHFLVEETNLEEVYADLLTDDSESSHQSLAVSLIGETHDGESITGSDGVDVFFSGQALRELLDDLAAQGVF